MTKQQEIQLKNGDEVFMKAVFDGIAPNGDAYVQFSWTNWKGKRVIGTISVTLDSVLRRSCMQQPAEKSKYDPCRLFKKGDKVRIVRRNNRHFNLETCRFHNKIATVDCNEKDLNPDTPLRLEVEGEYIYSDAAYLELVTPVEELEPYFVMELKGGYGVYNTRFQPETEACHYWNEMHPHAKEAAEAECARLNAEHRKEQPHGNQ